jgi:hypothetical protein
MGNQYKRNAIVFNILERGYESAPIAPPIVAIAVNKFLKQQGKL